MDHRTGRATPLGRDCPVCPTGQAGQQNAAALVALVDDVVHILRRRRGKWLETEVIQHEQAGTQIVLEPLVESAICPAAVDVAQHLVGVGGEDIEALAAGLVSQGVGQRGLVISPDVPLENIEVLCTGWEEVCWL